MRAHRTIEVESHLRFDRKPEKGLCETGRAVHLPLSLTGGECIRPLPESPFFAAVDLLPVPDQAHKHTPPRDAISRSNKKLWFGCRYALLCSHHPFVPSPLRLVEHDHVLRWDPTLHAVVENEF